ncbi:MAG TPA: hypothetical protein VMV49_00080 [Candidatus Deferrimicrobium sp.]|nr:hypothetical protein [Candidatus Deferrimicrobium sp.]
MAQKICAECGSPNIFYMCSQCNRSYCWEHTASNETFECSKCKAKYSKMNLVDINNLEFKCNAIDKSRCPKCKSLVYQKNSEKNRLYFQCTSCDWNSLFNTPLLVVENQNDLTEEGFKKNILLKKEIKYCGTKLKQLKTADQYLFCPGCFIDVLDSGDIFSFNQIAERFNLNTEYVFELLKSFQSKGTLKNVIDPIKKIYISLRPDYEKYLIDKLRKEPVNLSDLAKDMALEERQVRLILLNLTNNNAIKGHFLDAHNYIADDLIYKEIAEMIKSNESVPISEISRKYHSDEKETKRIISETINKGLVKAFFSPDSTAIIFGEGIQTKLLEILNEKGKIYIDRTAKALGIHPNLLRNQIKQFMENEQIEGWYTQDRGFATLKYLKSEVLGILQLYEKISIKELVSRIFLPVKYVELLLQTLIKEKQLAGALSDGVFKRSEITTIVKAKRTLPSWVIKKIEAAENLQHILIIQKLSGACLFSYACSALIFDPDLVSGFLQAISSFGTEVSSQETGLEEIRYQGFVVALSEGELVRSAFICNESPDSTLKSAIKYFIIKFEDDYRSYLEHWTGDVSIFKKCISLIEEYFKVGSKLLFLIPKIPKDQTISKEKILDKLQATLKAKGRISLERLEMELDIPESKIRKLLMEIALQGTGRFTIDQQEFVTEDKLNEEVAQIILSSTEIPFSKIAEKTKIGENEVEVFLQALLEQGTIRGRMENRTFYRE